MTGVAQRLKEGVAEEEAAEEELLRWRAGGWLLLPTLLLFC